MFLPSFQYKRVIIQLIFNLSALDDFSEVVCSFLVYKAALLIPRSELENSINAIELQRVNSSKVSERVVSKFTAPGEISHFSGAILSKIESPFREKHSIKATCNVLPSFFSHFKFARCRSPRAIHHRLVGEDSGLRLIRNNRRPCFAILFCVGESNAHTR